MKPSAPDPTPPLGPVVAPTDDEATGVPGLRTWRAVYLVVLGCFRHRLDGIDAAGQR